MFYLKTGVWSACSNGFQEFSGNGLCYKVVSVPSLGSPTALDSTCSGHQTGAYPAVVDRASVRDFITATFTR